MDNAIAKRAFSAVLAAATVLWALGAAAFAVPQAANAASAGDLVRSTSLSTVYFVGYDGARYAFPNEKTYDTWFNGFGDVQMISDSEVASMTLAGNVMYRPGARWIKITSNARTYAVARDGMIHWIETQEVADDFAGSDWNQNIDDVADALFTDYSEGVSLTSATVWDGALYMDGSDYMLSWDGMMYDVTSAGRSANDLETRFFLDGDSIDDSSLSSGGTIDGYNCDLSDASQTDCADEAVTGDVSVRASSSTAVGATLPKGANSVPVFSFELRAGSEAANVNGLTLDLEGATATTNISNVYLYEGTSRLTEARSVNAATREVTFGSLNLDVNAGQTRTLTVRVELSASASAGDEFYFSLENADAVDTDGDASGSFPVDGNLFEIANVTAGSLTVANNGTISNPSLGEDDAVIGQFKLTASSEDATLEELTLKIDNAADHDDFKLWTIGNELVANGTYIGDKLVSFDVDGVDVIEDGRSDIFKISADIGGESGDTIDPYLDNAVDVVATGGDYGYGMRITNSYASASQSTTIQGGDVTFAFKGPSTGDIRTNSQDQVLLELTLTTVQTITVKDLDIIVYADDDDDGDTTDGGDDSGSDADGLYNTTEGNLQDIRIVNTETGRTLMGPLELDGTTHGSGDDDADQTIDFTDDFEIAAGTTLKLAVTADIDDGVTSGETFAAALDISGFVAEDSNGDNLTNSTDVVPTSDITGNAQTANAASLAISLGSTPGDVTTVHGTEDVVVNRFNVEGGSAGVVDVSQVVLTVYSDDNNSTFTKGDTTPPDVNDYVSSCSIYDIDDNLLDGPNSPSSNGQTITFDDVSWQIAADENEELEVRCDFLNPTTTTTYYFAFDLDDVSEDIVAQDDDGTDVDPTGDDPNGATTPTNVVTVVDAGSLTTSLDSSSPSAGFVLTGTDDNLASVFNIAATNEDFTVKQLTLTEEAAEDLNGTSNSSAYTNNVERVTIEYPMADGTTGTASGSFNGNEADFSGLEIFVEEGDDALVYAYVDIAATERNSSGNATSNEFVNIGLSVDTSADDQFEAVGVGSGSTLDDDDVTAVATGARHVVRETVPTLAKSSASLSGVQGVSTDLEVLRFNVAASAGEDVVWSEMTFQITTSDAASSDWNFCDGDSGANASALDDTDFSIYNVTEDPDDELEAGDSDWTLYEANFAACASTPDTDIAFARVELTTPEVVPAGQTRTYALEMNVSGASAASDDTVQVSIPRDTVVSSANYLTSSDLDEGGGVAVTATNFTVTSGTAYGVGDILCLDAADDGCGSSDEKALVTAKATNELYVVRGYLGTTPAALTDADDVDYIPTSFLWQDDGSTSIAATTDSIDELWGAYLVDGIRLTGNAIQF